MPLALLLMHKMTICLQSFSCPKGFYQEGRTLQNFRKFRIGNLTERGWSSKEEGATHKKASVLSYNGNEIQSRKTMKKSEVFRKWTIH